MTLAQEQRVQAIDNIGDDACIAQFSASDVLGLRRHSI
jgi:hypothetical protein